ncbi:hypothetical protein K8R33_04555 [archaeon]|nr:hypothetical protein [archaeon]
MDTEILEDLGLTQAEIKVYIKLLELGSATAGPIIDKSGLQNSVIHRALNSLIEKGLINFIKEGKRNIYQATDPENFYNFIKEKERKFTKLLPELKKKQLMSKEKEKATIYKGKRGINEIYNILINTKSKEYLTFGGGHQCENLMGTSWWKSIHTKRIANKLSSRQVFDETVRDIGNKINKRRTSKVRFLTKEFSQFQETVIVGDLVAINIFTEDPYGVLIKDKAVADGYRKQFEILWKKAK